MHGHMNVKQEATLDKGYSKHPTALDLCIRKTTYINNYATSMEGYDMQRNILRYDSTNSLY